MKEIKGIIIRETEKYIYTVEFTKETRYTVNYVHALTGMILVRECTAYATKEEAEEKADLETVKRICKKDKGTDNVRIEIVEIECNGPDLHHKYKK